MNKVGRNAPCACGSGSKYKKCCGAPAPPQTPAQVDLAAIRSERVVLTVKAGTVNAKVLQIIFRPDNSVFVNFPYFQHRVGILATTALKENSHANQSLNLEDGGKVASHLVKYSHHPDGNAHFSQDGKIRTEIRRRSVPLSALTCHMFTVLIQGISAFEAAPATNPPTTQKRATLTFDCTTAPSEHTCLKLVGRWQHVKSLEWGPQVRSGTVGPIVPLAQRDGTKHLGWALANPRLDATHVLFVTCEPVAPICPEPETLVFIGGFDPPDIINDPSVSTGFLAFIYPADNAEALVGKLGTVDFR